MKYCQKEDTRVSGPYEFGSKPKENGKRGPAKCADIDSMDDNERWRSLTPT